MIFRKYSTNLMIEFIRNRSLKFRVGSCSNHDSSLRHAMYTYIYPYIHRREIVLYFSWNVLFSHVNKYNLCTTAFSSNSSRTQRKMSEAIEDLIINVRAQINTNTSCCPDSK